MSNLEGHLADKQLEVLHKWDKAYAKAEGALEVHTGIIGKRVQEQVTEFNPPPCPSGCVCCQPCFAYFCCPAQTFWT